MQKKVAFFLPHFSHGGAEGVVLRLLMGMDRARYLPVLLLQHRRGELLAKLPDDILVLSLRFPRLPGCVGELARLFAREKFSLVVTLTNASSLYAVLAARLSRTETATLVTEHTPISGFLIETKLPKLRRAAIRWIYPLATLTGGPIEDIGAELDDMLGDAAPPFAYLPNPVVEKVGSLRAPLVNARHIVSVGRLAPEKRFELLIDAFAILYRDLPDARLTIFGEGRERSALEAQVNRLGLENAVAMPGYTMDLDAVHQSADLFVCTSRREGLGNAIIEAMARGVPVVSVDCPFGPRRLLRDGLAGYLVESDTPDIIARAMGHVLADHPLRSSYADAGLDIARKYMNRTAIAVYQAAFDRAIAAKPKPRLVL